MQYIKFTLLLFLTLSLQQNLYTNNKLDNTQQINLQWQEKIFFSYEKSYLRIKGLSVGDFKLFGAGVKYKFVQAGLYFPNIDVQSYEGLQRYLCAEFGDRIWRHYDIKTSIGIGISLEHTIGNFIFGCRFLSIPVKYIGWDIENDVWWHYITKENFNYTYIGIRW